MDRHPELYLTPSGDVLVPPEIARILWIYGGLKAFSARARGTIAAPVIEALRQSAERLAPRPVPRDGTKTTEPRPPVAQSLNTHEAAQQLGITPRAVTKAIENGRLHAQRTGRFWNIDPDELARFSGTRTEST